MNHPPVPVDEQQLFWECQDCFAAWEYGELVLGPEQPDCLHDNMQRYSPCCGNHIDPDIGFCSCGERA